MNPWKYANAEHDPDPNVKCVLRKLSTSEKKSEIKNLREAAKKKKELILKKM